MRATRPLPLHPLLLAAWFVLALYAANLGEAELGDVLPVLGATVAGGVLVLLGSAVLLRLTGRRDLATAGLLASGVLVVALGYGHVEQLVEPWDVPGWLLQLVALALVAAAFVAVRRAGPAAGSLTRRLNLLTAVLVAVTLVSIVPAEVARLTRPPTAEASVPVTGEPLPGPKRDVWYLIFDRYGSHKELESILGVRSGLDEWLTDHDFYLAADSHANYVKTALSLASSLNLEHLDGLAARMGPDSADEQPIYDRLQDHAVARFLRSQGYRYVHVGSAYQPTNVNWYADDNPRTDSLPDFTRAFVDTTIVPAVVRRIGLTRALPMRERYYEMARFQWRTLDELVERPGTGPRLVFCHFLLPHPPYVFNPDGSFVSEAGRLDVVGAFADQLAYTDAQIERLVERLLALPEERRPIIVLQADEGPYPERYNRNTATFDWAGATTEELRLKYGILNAYYLPGLDGDTGLYPSITPVNSFRLIFDRYFGADLPLLPDRSYTSKAKARPYDLTDVTDRLQEPDGG